MANDLKPLNIKPAKSETQVSENTEKETVKVDHTNPFNHGVTYKSFLKAIGEKSIAEVLKDVCTPIEIDWIEREVEQYKKQK